MKRPKAEHDKTIATTRGLICPYCGNHIHLVIVATDPNLSGTMRKKMDRVKLRER